jgi:hypothetical protein
MGFFGDVYDFFMGEDQSPSTYNPERYQFDRSAFRPGRGAAQTEAALRRRMMGTGTRQASPSVEQMKAALGQQARRELTARAAGQGSPERMGSAMGAVLGKSGAERAQEQAAATNAMQQYLAMKMGGQMTEQEMQMRHQQALNQLYMQQALANAAGREKQGLLGSILQGVGSGVAAGITQSSGQQMQAPLGGSPQWQGGQWGYGQDLRQQFSPGVDYGSGNYRGQPVYDPYQWG